MIGRGLSVLLVDANEIMRKTVASLLRADGFERVMAVESASDALEILRFGRVDLALIDWSIGKESGFELAEQIRLGVSPRKDLPIILILGQADPKQVLAAQGLGVNAVLVKPISKTELDKKIVQALGSVRRKTVGR
jgi:two-component system chemotaxis response regulator CheY